MVVSNDQPVSAANLKAAVEALAGGGYFNEVVWAGGLTSSCMVSGDLGKFKEFKVEREDQEAVTIPAVDGEYKVGNNYFDINDSGKYFYLRARGWQFSRIVGYLK